MYVHVRVHVCLTDRIAECIRQRLPYADVTGVETVDDLVDSLSHVPPPIFFTRDNSSGSGVPLNTPLGCFIRGAGMAYYIMKYMLA